MNYKQKINLGLVLSILLAFLVIFFSIYSISNYLFLAKEKPFEFSDLNYVDENIQIYILPQQAALDKIMFELNDANSEINCSLRSLNYEKLESIFIAKEKEIKVRLFVNEDYKGNKRIYLPFVKFENRILDQGMMHNNYCIIDKKKVIAGSIIFNENTIYKNIHDVLIIDSQELASEYNSDFWKLYNYQELEKKESNVNFIRINNDVYIRPHFCPSENCESIILNEFISAKEKIKIATYSFTSESIIDKLIDLNFVEKKIVIEPYGINENSINYRKINWVKTSNLIENVHTKLITIDNNISITGNMNLTFFGFNKNSENFLIIKSEKINKFYGELIDYLYENSK